MSAALAPALEIIKRWEGLELRAYPDPATGGDPWTIGYGATGPGIRKGVVWTQAQADEDLRTRVTLLLQQVQARLTKPATPNELAAMASLAYNIGIGAFGGSTLLRLFNAGDRVAAALQFLRWDRANGKQMRGLAARRKDEMELFNSAG